MRCEPGRGLPLVPALVSTLRGIMLRSAEPEALAADFQRALDVAAEDLLGACGLTLVGMPQSDHPGFVLTQSVTMILYLQVSRKTPPDEIWAMAMTARLNQLMHDLQMLFEVYSDA